MWLLVGRGLLLAASGDACPATPVKDLPNFEMNLLYSECGLATYREQQHVVCKKEPMQFSGKEPAGVKDELEDSVCSEGPELGDESLSQD